MEPLARAHYALYSLPHLHYCCFHTAAREEERTQAWGEVCDLRGMKQAGQKLRKAAEDGVPQISRKSEHLLSQNLDKILLLAKDLVLIFGQKVGSNAYGAKEDLGVTQGILSSSKRHLG